MPVSMMDAVVAYQMDDRNAPLPPVEEIIADAEARIAKREERLSRIRATVTAGLSEQSEAEIGGLQECLVDLRRDDPLRAVKPQDENLKQMVADLRVINEKTLGALARTDQQLAERTRENGALRNELQNLRSRSAAASNAQIKKFLSECSERGSQYVSK